MLNRPEREIEGQCRNRTKNDTQNPPAARRRLLPPPSYSKQSQIESEEWGGIIYSNQVCHSERGVGPYQHAEVNKDARVGRQPIGFQWFLLKNPPTPNLARTTSLLSARFSIIWSYLCRKTVPGDRN